MIHELRMIFFFSRLEEKGQTGRGEKEEEICIEIIHGRQNLKYYLTHSREKKEVTPILNS
jgi:hypothetical protein